MTRKRDRKPEDTWSDHFNWILQDEGFKYFGTTWDVGKAKRLIKAKPRKVLTLSTTQEAGLIYYEGSKNEIPFFSIFVDKYKAEEVDIQFPLIVIQRENVESFCVEFTIIDGWHRIHKASTQNIFQLPAVFLSINETKRVRVS